MPIPFLAALISCALASEAPTDAYQQAPERTQALYGHPTTTAASLLASTEGTPILILPITYERELGDGKSWTLQPMLIVGKLAQDTVPHMLDDGYDIPPDLSAFHFQLLGTQRNYFNGKTSKGWYWAPAVKLSFTHLSQPFKQGMENYWIADDVTAFGIGALGYVGWRGKWGAFTMYVDGGLGGQYAAVSGNRKQDYTTSGLAYDLNIGLGKAF